jgi:ElaB/YqjD/DUF883 family membrane-anchored ribosome-binding protein
MRIVFLDNFIKEHRKMAQNSPARDHLKISDSSAHDLKEKATDQFEKVADQAQHVVNRVATHGREVGERVQEVAGNLKGAVDRSVKHQPMATLAMVVVMGFVFGALWKS